MCCEAPLRLCVNFLMICDRMNEKSQSLPSRAPFRSNFWFLVGAFRRKTQTIVVTSFFKTNELTDFISWH